jgi:ElaB/YqjD/DUF883 family membrane-anchored ribosome-binding protein
MFHRLFAVLAHVLVTPAPWGRQLSKQEMDIPSNALRFDDEGKRLQPPAISESARLALRSPLLPARHPNLSLLLPRSNCWTRVYYERKIIMEAAKRGDNEKTLHDLGTAVREGEDLLKAAAGEPGEKGRALRAKLETAVEKAKALYERLEEKTVAAAKAADQTVREHPYQAIGIAFGVGLLIGVLAARSRRD